MVFIGRSSEGRVKNLMDALNRHEPGAECVRVAGESVAGRGTRADRT